jgi:Tfp pilus assembly PilM family ATPase
MALSMFSSLSTSTPIVADFGSSSLKLLQTSPGDKPTVIAAAEIPVPDELRGQTLDRRFEHFAQQLPKVLKDNGFKGRRVVCSPSSGQMLVQHMQVPAQDDPIDLIKAQLQQQLNIDTSGVVVRSVRVSDQPNSQGKVEHIAFAIARDDVMRYVELFKKLKIQVAAVHNEVQALLHAFDHINRRDSDVDVSTLYIDLGWGSTKVAIGHGARLVFAKCIALGGRHFDSVVAQAFKCDLASARARRMSEDFLPLRQAPAPVAGQKPASGDEGGLAMLRAGMAQADTDARLESIQQPAAQATEDRRGLGAPKALGSDVPEGSGPIRMGVDFTEQLESLADELSMCTRYHAACFPGRAIDRVVFLGGEARQIGLCQYLAEALGLPAKSGDPLARLLGTTPPPGLPDPGQPHPAWAVACGLCVAPVDL